MSWADIVPDRTDVFVAVFLLGIFVLLKIPTYIQWIKFMDNNPLINKKLLRAIDDEEARGRR